MAKVGRPKEDNPKETIVGVRLTKEEHNRLLSYAKDHDMTITQVLKDGVKEVIGSPG